MKSSIIGDTGGYNMAIYTTDNNSTHREDSNKKLMKNGRYISITNYLLLYNHRLMKKGILYYFLIRYRKNLLSIVK